MQLEELGYMIGDDSLKEIHEHLLAHMQRLQGQGIIVTYRSGKAYRLPGRMVMVRKSEQPGKLLALVYCVEDLSKTYKTLETDSYEDAAFFISCLSFRQT